jgi:hypothetical protein
MTRTDLEWGQTPWDRLSREELLREVQRYYAALTETRSALAMQSNFAPAASFWSVIGSGGFALAMANSVLSRVDADDQACESAFRSFFRYAYELLFPDVPQRTHWAICDTCGRMVGHPESRAGVLCASATGAPCTGTMRAFTWEDLAPKLQARADRWDFSFADIDALSPGREKAVQWLQYALTWDGGHHKQWFIERAMEALEIDLERLAEELKSIGVGTVEHDAWQPGIAP